MPSTKACFVIMPFSKTTDAHDESYWENLFTDFIKPALAAHGYEAHKSVDTPNNITKHIVRELAFADLVLAVLTDHKPNVLYELGVRHSLRQGTIMILEGDQRPFDISNYGILSYGPAELEKFKLDLGRYIKFAEQSAEDSPVADFLNQRITVSVNLAIGRLRQCVGIIKEGSSADLSSSLGRIGELQKAWNPEKEQVSVVVDDKMELHVDPANKGRPASEYWPDETWQEEPRGAQSQICRAPSLYPVMKARRWGFRIAQIRDKRNRLTAIAFETVETPSCMVIAEAHYHQESRPY